MVITVDILVVNAYSGMVLCTPILLNHDYEDGGVADISAVDTYSRVEIWT
jgi:ligand-binding sensor protein